MAEIKEKNQMKSSWDSNLWKKIADFFEHNIWAISGNKIIEGYFEIDNPFFRGFYIFNSENVGSFYILAIFSDHIDKNRMDFTLKVILKALKKEGWGKITTPLTEVMRSEERRVGKECRCRGLGSE